MEIYILSSSTYKDIDKNHGDCILVIKDKNAVVYDCGSEEHAEKVIDILREKNINRATAILSHNDDDHFLGFPYLIKNGYVTDLYTVLLLKYADDILEKLDDGRRNKDSVKRAITEKYDNIYSLKNTVKLHDVYEENTLPDFVEFIGPDFDYMIEVAAKAINDSEGDIIELETVTNAASVQIKILFNSQKILLTGDCSPRAIPDRVKLNNFDYIQLPHHGKPLLANEIFEKTFRNNDIIFIVSDNTGKSNGGSDGLDTRGHRVRNTKNGTIHFTKNYTSTYGGRLG